MGKMIKRKKRLLVVVLIVAVLSQSINIINDIRIHNKIKTYDETNNQSLFELCEYLYDTDEYKQVYKYFSLVLRQKEGLEFFTDLGFDKEQATAYMSSWSAKYLISSAAVNKKTASDDFIYIFKIIQQAGMAEAFFEAVDKQMGIEYGVLFSYSELSRLKRFMDYVSTAIEDFEPEMKIQGYTYLISQSASLFDFKTSEEFSWKRSEEECKMTLIDKSGGAE